MNMTKIATIMAFAMSLSACANAQTAEKASPQVSAKTACFQAGGRWVSDGRVHYSCVQTEVGDIADAQFTLSNNKARTPAVDGSAK